MQMMILVLQFYVWSQVVLFQSDCWLESLVGKIHYHIKKIVK